MGYTSEFPLLYASGLYAANTAGNGKWFRLCGFFGIFALLPIGPLHC